MVLALPLLMGIMGLLMVFGFVASWKVRSEVVARDIGWRSRFPRHNVHERSEEWPELEDEDRHLGLYTQGAGNLDSVDAQSVVHAPIIRGPIPEINVNSGLLDLAKGVTRGVSEVNQPSQVMGEIGRTDYTTTNEFASNPFTYETIGVSPFARRIPKLWNIELDGLYDDGGIGGLIFAINGFRDPIVLALDEDMDFYHWNARLLSSRHVDEFGNETLEWAKWDFPPSLPDPDCYKFILDFSTLDQRYPNPGLPPTANGEFFPHIKNDSYKQGRQQIRDTVVEAYLNQIPGVPEEMASRTRDLFSSVIRYHNRDLVEPRLTLQEKNQLDKWVEDLNNYIDELNEQDD